MDSTELDRRWKEALDSHKQAATQERSTQEAGEKAIKEWTETMEKRALVPLADSYNSVKKGAKISVKRNNERSVTLEGLGYSVEVTGVVGRTKVEIRRDNGTLVSDIRLDMSLELITPDVVQDIILSDFKRRV